MFNGLSEMDSLPKCDPSWRIASPLTCGAAIVTKGAFGGFVALPAKLDWLPFEYLTHGLRVPYRFTVSLYVAIYSQLPPNTAKVVAGSVEFVDQGNHSLLVRVRDKPSGFRSVPVRSMPTGFLAICPLAS